VHETPKVPSPKCVQTEYVSVLPSRPHLLVRHSG